MFSAFGQRSILFFVASNFVGFGLMDAYRIVSFAKNWTKVPPQLNYTTSSHQKNRFVKLVLNRAWRSIIT